MTSVPSAVLALAGCKSARPIGELTMHPTKGFDCLRDFAGASMSESVSDVAPTGMEHTAAHRQLDDCGVPL
jgi:hypothetical protein